MQSIAPQLIQMSGVPGAGKSTIARALGARFDLIVLDHDLTKSGILATGLADKAAGRASYEAIKALAGHFIASGRAVLIDSPCIYPELLEFGEQLAARAGVPYRYIECRVEDLDLIHTRLSGRDAMPSQLRSLSGEVEITEGLWRPAREVFLQWRRNAARPKLRLTLDTTSPVGACIEAAVAYVAEPRGADDAASGARLTRQLADLAPTLEQETFVYCMWPTGLTDLPEPLASFREGEGLTVVLELGLAQAKGLRFEGTYRCITLSVVSQLTDVGLTAAVAGALSEAGIAANFFAAMHHDHILVPEVDAVRAMATLTALAAAARVTM